MGPESVNVEAPDKPRRGRPKGSKNRATKAGAIKPEHIAGLTVQMFHLAAVIKNARYWEVENSQELDYWTPAAAELANKYIDEVAAQKALEFNAAVTVVMGLGIMIVKRMTLDNQVRMQNRRRAQQKRVEEPPTHPQEVKPSNVRPMTRPNDYGGGAAPTRPSEPLEGLGTAQPGLS